MDAEADAGPPPGGATAPPSTVPPRRLVSRDEEEGPGGRRPRVVGTVRVASGPWAMEEGWWRDAPAARDYWDVELDDGALYRIYRNRADGRWWADGVYD